MQLGASRGAQPPTLDSRPVDLERLGERLRELRLCDPAAVERMGQSLSRHGQLTAVTVFDDGELFQIVDGFKRVHAAQRLGWRSVGVCVLSVGEAEAAAAIATLHHRRELTDLEEGWLVRWLYREHGLSQGAIARLMGKHKSWVSRRLMLAESLDTAVQADVRLGLLSPRAALSVSALPRGNQRQAAELIVTHGLTTRQAESLVRCLRALGSDEERELALQRGSLEGVVTSRRPVCARPRSEGEQLMADVATLLRVGVRVEIRLLDCPLAGLGADGSAHVTAALTELGTLLGSLERAIARAVHTQGKVDARCAVGTPVKSWSCRR